MLRLEDITDFTEGRRDLVYEDIKPYLGQIKAVAFDIDGTLTDSIPWIDKCTVLAFEKMGLPVPPKKDILGIIGIRLDEGLQKILPEGKKHLKDEITRVYRSIYTADPAYNLAPLFPGMDKMLYALKERGYKIGFVSGKSNLGLHRALECTMLGEVCDGYCAGDEVPSKPHPQMLLTLANRLGLQPFEILGVGDAGLDVMLYHNAHAVSCGVQSGVWSGDAFLKLRPHLILPDATYLTDYLL